MLRILGEPYLGRTWAHLNLHDRPSCGGIDWTVAKACTNNGSMLELLSDVWAFMRVRKRYWLLPAILCLLVIAAVVAFASVTAVGPFIYTLF